MIRITSLIAILSLLALHAIADSSTPQNQRLALSGRIVDANGKPLPNASVTLVAGADYSRRYLSELDPDVARIAAETGDAGEFTVAFQRDDTRFLAGETMALVIQHPNHQSQRLNFDIARMQAGVPLEDVKMSSALRTKVQIRDHDGKPFSGVHVSAAVINGRNLPWAVARQAQAVSEADGSVLIPQADPDFLEGVFVVGPSAGYHRLDIVRSPTGELHVEVPETRAVHGEITCPTEDRISGVGSTSLFACSLKSGSIFYQPSRQCSWQIARFSDQGSVDISALALGDLSYLLICPADFPFRASQLDSDDRVETLVPGTTPQQWEIRFKKQTQLRATILESITETPLPNLCIESHDGRYQTTFTDDEGKASFYRTIDNVSYYPRDNLGEYFLGKAFYQDSDRVPVDGVIELQPMLMHKRLPWKGQVVDQDGQPVAAAKVVYEFSRERFTQSDVTYSDSDGYFQLSDVQPKTAVKIRAEKHNAASELENLVFPTKDAFELKVTDRAFVRPTGRLVDLDGNPVSGVSVSLKRGILMIKEGYNAEELRPEELYDPPESARTDSEGRFLFPTTINFKHPLQVQVVDPNCFPYYSPFVDFSKIDTGLENGKLDMGDFTIMPRLKRRMLNVVVQSSTGAPISDAEVVAVGARTGTQHGITNDSGKIGLSYWDGKSVLAVSAEGYRVHFAELPNSDQQVRVVLHSESEERQGQSISDLDPKVFLSAAKKVFLQVPKPELEHSTPHRMMTYLYGQAAVDPIGFIEAAKSKGMKQFASMASSSLTGNTDLVEHAIDQSVVEHSRHGDFLLQAAAKSNDPEQQEDLLGEAIVASRGISSAMHRGYVMSTISAALLASGRTEDAKRLMKEVWAAASELHEVVAAGERKKMTGGSRGIGPMLAIIDFEKSKELIRLVGREIEVDSLLTQARLYHAQANPKKFVQAIEDGSLTDLNNRGVETWLRQVATFRGMFTQGVPQPEKVAALIPDPKARLGFVLVHARTTEDLWVRDRLMRLAVDSIRESSSNSADDHYLFHYTGKMLPELRAFDSLEPEFLDQLVFAALWNMPHQFEGDRYQTILGGASQILALRDRELAKTLLEPAFDDLGWLFMGRQLSLRQSSALNSLAGVDPEWCVEVVDRLCAEQLKYDPVDQLELRAGVANALMDVMPKP